MKTVLVVDDEPLLTELLEFRLAARDYNPIVARDGREALARLEDSALLTPQQGCVCIQSNAKYAASSRRFAPDI